MGGRNLQAEGGGGGIKEEEEEEEEWRTLQGPAGCCCTGGQEVVAARQHNHTPFTPRSPHLHVLMVTVMESSRNLLAEKMLKVILLEIWNHKFGFLFNFQLDYCHLLAKLTPCIFQPQ